VGAELSASLPALAGGISSNNNYSSNTPAPTPIGAEGAVSRAGFCGAASAGAPQGAYLAARAASQPFSVDVDTAASSSTSAVLPQRADPPSPDSHVPLASRSRVLGVSETDIRCAFYQAPCQSSSESSAGTGMADSYARAARHVRQEAATPVGGALAQRLVMAAPPGAFRQEEREVETEPIGMDPLLGVLSHSSAPGQVA
jgi:hypothetical protein